VATALQMISWGVEVNDYGNAILDEGQFIKHSDRGVSEEIWAEMQAFAQTHNLKGGDFKKLNLPFENKFLAQPKEIRDRMAKDVETFVFGLLTTVFNATDTAQIVIDEILKNNSHDPGFKAEKIESEKDWTKEKILEKAADINTDKGPKGNFDD
jgi:hypothetical protein